MFSMFVLNYIFDTQNCQKLLEPNNEVWKFYAFKFKAFLHNKEKF